MHLQKSSIWNVIDGCETIGKFHKKFISSIYLCTQANEHVQKEIELAKKLLLHSYYEYEFIDIALTQAIFAFEKALKEVYKKSNPNNKAPKLNELIDWAVKNAYFETINQDVPHQLRKIRNGKAHDEEASLGGLSFINTIHTTIDLINDLYEDVDLRKQRRSEIESIKFFENSDEGNILTHNNRRYILHKSFPILINNKTNPKIFTIACCPIFDLEPYRNDKHFLPNYITLSATDWKIENNILSATDIYSRSVIIIEPINGMVNRNRYANWKKELHNLKDYNLMLFIFLQPLNNIFIDAVRKLHKS